MNLSADLIMRIINSSRATVTARPGAIVISQSQLDCAFCGAVAERVYRGRGVCYACMEDLRRVYNRDKEKEEKDGNS